MFHRQLCVVSRVIRPEGGRFGGKGKRKVEHRRSKVEGRRSKVEGRRSKVEGRSAGYESARGLGALQDLADFAAASRFAERLGVWSSSMLRAIAIAVHS